MIVLVVEAGIKEIMQDIENAVCEIEVLMLILSTEIAPI